MKKTGKLIAKSPWIPHKPEAKQVHFLALQDLEALYGGQAGGGKSDALLMGALMYADVPNFSAIIFRRTYPELAQAGGLIPRAKDWLGPTPAVWNEQRSEWRFPSGAKLRFGHMQHEKDRFDYQSGEYQYIGFDELTGFSESMYTYMFSRLRRLNSLPAPVRVRGASNPGNVGHQWVYDRFVAGGKPFIPASLYDNPHLDREQYTETMQELDPVTRNQLLKGLWVTDPLGKPFKREWWLDKNRYDPADISWANKAYARYVAFDTANKKEDVHAYTALCVGDILPDYRMVLRHVNQERKSFDELPDWITRQVEPWNYDWKLKNVAIEDAASGIQAVQVLQASGEPWIKPRIVPVKAIGKEESWAAASLWCARDCVLLPIPSDETPWLGDFEAQIYNVPDTTFKDMADAFALLINYVEWFVPPHPFSTRWRAQRMLRTGEPEVA